MRLHTYYNIALKENIYFYTQHTHTHTHTQTHTP